MNKILLTLLLLGSVSATARAQLLSDDFNGSSIDPAIWVTSTPFAGSSITESGGNAIFQDRGRLVTQATLPVDIVISGRFRITGDSSDEFQIVFRTDGTFAGQFGDSANGFVARFRSDAFFVSDEISLLEAGGGTAFAGWTGTLSLNTYYDFKITDDGFRMSLFVGDMTTPKVTLASSNVSGSKIALYNREQTGSIHHQTQLDSIRVATVGPEPESAVSRKTHGSAGTFDVPLPLSGSGEIECRRGSGANHDGHQMIITFTNPVTVGSADVTLGTGSVDSFSVSGTQVTVNLTGVANAQRITVTLGT